MLTDSPIQRRNGDTYLRGYNVRTSDVWDKHITGQEPWVIAREYPDVPVEAIEFAIGYERKKRATRERRRNDPKRAARLMGKRNASSGRRAEEWVVKMLGDRWKRRGGSGRVDVEYIKPTYSQCNMDCMTGCAHGPEHVPLPGCDAIRTLEVKRRKNEDRTLRMQLVQNGASALVRTYGAGDGQRQIEPTVTMRWSTWCELLREAGYVVAGREA